MEEYKSFHCFGGRVSYVRHWSSSTKCTMQFSLFLPRAADFMRCKTLVFLSGLTCTEENFTTKAGAYRAASQKDMIVVAPDTSPRGVHVPDDESYDLGQGAGFYIDAVQEPWTENFLMESYVANELLSLLVAHYPLDAERVGVSGHSMGGHGALTLFLKYPQIFSSVSALSPICSPTQCTWGEKAFSAYLGSDRKMWRNHDASCLMRRLGSSRRTRPEILIDQGLSDSFLTEQLKPELFESACRDVGYPLTLRRHEQYDHSYFFISSFIEDHINHHVHLL